MTINIFVLKGDLNGKIVVVRFFFCRVYKLLGKALHVFSFPQLKHVEGKFNNTYVGSSQIRQDNSKLALIPYQ